MTAQRHKTPRQRFDEKWRKSETSDCWEWIANKNPYGYGTMRFGGRKNRMAHAVAKALYENVDLEKIPKGMQWDHLCRNRGCVNPAHLELVTQAENARRGVGISVQNQKKTHCPKGHALVEGNLVKMKNPSHRSCLTCRRENSSRYYQKHIRPKKGLADGK